MDAGCDGLRINPGNIGSKSRVKSVVSKAREHRIPIRIGVNSGSLEKRILKKYAHPNAPALVESAIGAIRTLEDLDFHEMKVSIKAADVLTTVEAYRLLSEKVDYPLHVGVTEAGPFCPGTVKSSIGIGILLYYGIGDTIRVSLTRDPVDEVRVAYEILKALKLRVHGPDIVSCPTCGRCEIDLISLVEQAEERLLSIKTPLKVAIMGCVVNGPGEAREADVGIAGGKGVGILFKKGKVIRRLKEKELLPTLIKEVHRMSEGGIS
jgi:(E)-4-hydroxy-3-methylbut-2-enyl-diphosphate synthase